MNDRERHKSIIECAKLYKERVLNYNYRFVFCDDVSEFHTVEVRFKSSNFAHLVGITKSNSLSASEIFSRATRNTLSLTDYTISKPDICELKLSVFPDLLNFQQKVKYIGFYNGAKFALQTELITGNQLAAMGYKREYENIFYPNTVLKQDCRTLLLKQYRILAIYRKYFKDKNYSSPIMIHKEFDEHRYKQSLSQEGAIH